MAHAATASAVGTSSAPSSHAPQASLRDYLNERIGPFLKKAMIASLKSDSEYPLQWLGEFLINESIKHEGNPDSTNIKSHFRYRFDEPAPPAPVAPGDNIIPDVGNDISANGVSNIQVNGNSQAMEASKSDATSVHQDTEMQD